MLSLYKIGKGSPGMNVQFRLRTTVFFCTLSLSALLSLSHVTLASELEISAMLGQMHSSDLITDNGTAIKVDSARNIAIGIAWQESNNGQGQILLNRVSHDFTSENNTHNVIDITYAHFNGVAMLRQQYYVTTISLGVGGAYLDADYGSDKLYPSATAAIGTRYEFYKNMTIVTELRGYATLINKDDAIFCQQALCRANFDNSLWTDSTISVGIAIKY